MMRKIKNYINRLPKKFIVLCMLLAISFSYFSPIASVFSLTHFGEGEECFTFDMDNNGFPVSSVTINGEQWEKNADYQYHSDDNRYTIVVKAGKKGDDYPWISTAGGLDDYKTYTAVENPNEDPNVEGDEVILTLTIDGIPYNKESCLSFGVSLAPGPFPVVPELTAEGDITISISGDELEYHYVADKPDEADVSRFKFGINNPVYNPNTGVFEGTSSNELVPFTFGNAEYTYNDKEPPNNVTRVVTKQPIHYQYGYDGSGYVSFCVNGGAEDEYTKIEINGVNYANQAPHTQIEVFEHLIGRASMFCIDNVPYDEDGYDVVVEGRRVTEEKTVAGFGWNYLSRERSNLGENEAEGNFAHGRLEFVQAKYTDIDNVSYVFNSVQEYNAARFHDTGTIYEWQDGRKDYPEEDRRQSWGEALIPYGTELTVRVVPDEGYQLTSFSTSPNGFQATDEFGVYKIVLTKENFKYENGGFDLEPVFTQVGNTVKSDSEKVSGGTIETNKQVENGTIKLEVNDVNVPGDSREAFEEKATDEGYEINNYVDLSLYNSIYKGGKKDANDNYLSWDTEINNLENNATITLNLEDDMSGKDIALIHEKHIDENNTEYELINAVYDAENNTITFETNSFSNYAIVTKANNNETEWTVTFDSNGGSEVEPKKVIDGNAVAEPEPPTNGDLVFDGWYEDSTFNSRFDFHTPITGDLTLYAKWNENNNEEPEQPSDEKDYDIKDSQGNEVLFKKENGRTFKLSIVDYLTFTKEQIMDLAGITSEQYDQIFDVLRANTKPHGDLISFYEIDVLDENDDPTYIESLTLRIFATEEMKKYSTLTLYFLEDDFSLSSPVVLTRSGNYFEGHLEHLSTYVLVGSNPSAPSSNPNTGDNINMWYTILIVSSIGLVIGTAAVVKLRKGRN